MTPLAAEIHVLRRCIDWCDTGFEIRSAGFYEIIAAELEPFREASKTVDTAARLAQGGRGLTSPRFAYPHVKDRLVDRLKELGEDEP
jgi:hypothetical protein